LEIFDLDGHNFVSSKFIPASFSKNLIALIFHIINSEELFRYEVFKMLKAEGKITDVIIENMMNWRHSGFHVYCGKAIWPHNEEGLENLSRYIIRASFSQERMTYIAANDASDGVSKVIYQSKDGTTTKTFDALDWLAQLVIHIPNKGESACGGSDITDFILINRAAYAKRPVSMIKCRH
jgi:hypothetical protein